LLNDKLSTLRKKVAIIGAGASGLMLAANLRPEMYEVTVYERNVAVGRKFLVAGDGGLNLTHSENPERFIKRYTPHYFLEDAFRFFDNQKLVEWLSQTGIETFTGSSGRIFPEKGIKPITVLNAIIDCCIKNEVEFKYRYQWTGFNGTNLLFETVGENVTVRADIIVYCPGGASWPVTGSKGDWGSFFEEKGIKINPFLPSNCSYKIDWPEELIAKIEGKALKNIAISCGGNLNAGEIVLTRSGLEGSGIYPLSPQIRQQFAEKGRAIINLDLKPSFEVKKVTDLLLSERGSRSYTDHLQNKLKLTSWQIQLLKTFLTKEEFLDPSLLAVRIKSFPLTIVGTGNIEDAISTVGGIDLSEIDENFQLRKMPGSFVLGEMLDYDAPTGGYLLQSCFTMAKYLAQFLNHHP
jgi:uncharacterized flavoprotein (TIGR03862 family)